MNGISRRSLFLLILDCIAMLLAFQLTAYWLYHREFGVCVKPEMMAVSFFTYPLFFYIFDLYFPFKYYRPAKSIIDIALASACAVVVVSTLCAFNRSLAMPRLFFIAVNLVFVPGVLIVRLVYDVLFQARMVDKKTLIIGTGALAQTITQVIHKTPHSGIELVGLVSEQGTAVQPGSPIPVVGNISQLLSLIDWYHVQLVVLAIDAKSKSSEPELMLALMRQKVQVTSAIHLFEKLDEAIPYDGVNEHFILALMSEVRSLRYLHVKRIFDIGIVSALLLLFSPVMLLAYLFLFFQGPKTVFFLQDRIGINGKIFKMIKFRTMTRPDSAGRQRVTGVGKWLRKFRVDETPQLLNILKGDMSLIGPRPEISYFVEKCHKIIPYYDAVFSVRPGITGWAQVKFLHTTEMKDYPRKFCYNLFYLKNLSFSLDFLIVLKTIRVVLLGKGK